MDATEIIQEKTDSMEITKNFKGELGYKVKAYGDTPEEIDDKVNKLKALAEAKIRK